MTRPFLSPGSGPEVRRMRRMRQIIQVQERGDNQSEWVWRRGWQAGIVVLFCGYYVSSNLFLSSSFSSYIYSFSKQSQSTWMHRTLYQQRANYIRQFLPKQLPYYRRLQSRPIFPSLCVKNRYRSHKLYFLTFFSVVRSLENACNVPLLDNHNVCQHRKGTDISCST